MPGSPNLSTSGGKKTSTKSASAKRSNGCPSRKNSSTMPGYQFLRKAMTVMTIAVMISARPIVMCFVVGMFFSTFAAISESKVTVNDSGSHHGSAN